MVKQTFLIRSKTVGGVLVAVTFVMPGLTALLILICCYKITKRHNNQNGFTTQERAPLSPNRSDSRQSKLGDY